MKVLLVYPPISSDYGKERPPLGPAYLYAALKKGGINVKFFDIRVEKKSLYSEIESFKPNLIGMTSTTFEFKKVEGLAENIKKRFKIPIALGGVHATLVPDKILKKEIFDFVFIGEAEKTIIELCRALQSKDKYRKIKSINGIGYLKNGKIVINKKRNYTEDLDLLPFPDYSGFKLNRYVKSFTIFTSRGCPYQCIYCSAKELFGTKFRFRSAKNVVDEIELLKKKYNVNDFQFSDDNFAIKQKRAIEICKEIIKRKLNIKWSCDQGLKVNTVTKELAHYMKKSGCTNVAIGVESSSNKILRNLKKGATIEQTTNAIKICKDAGLVVKAFFLIGSPGETFRDTLDNIKYFKRLDIDAPRFSILTPYPGTELWDYVKRNNLFNKNFDLTVHSSQAVVDELKNPVPFGTKEYPVKQRSKAYNLALDEMERWIIKKFIKRKLKKFDFLAPFITIWFYPRFVRRYSKKVYMRFFKDSIKVFE